VCIYVRRGGSHEFLHHKSTEYINIICSSREHFFASTAADFSLRAVFGAEMIELLFYVVFLVLHWLLASWFIGFWFQSDARLHVGLFAYENYLARTRFSRGIISVSLCTRGILLRYVVQFRSDRAAKCSCKLKLCQLKRPISVRRSYFCVSTFLPKHWAKSSMETFSEANWDILQQFFFANIMLLYMKAYWSKKTVTKNIWFNWKLIYIQNNIVFFNLKIDNNDKRTQFARLF
jgi:hypothetical protein